MSRCPFSGVELRGQVHLQKFWFVENLSEIPENSGTEVSTRLFTISYLTFFSEKKIFGPVQVFAQLSMKNPVVTFRQVFNGLKLSKD